jgi:ubiquinone/menaquinone biosynthesis C-methylase UbiE
MKIWRRPVDHNEPQWSYDRQLDHDSLVLAEKNLPSCYSNPNSIDAWRHDRMYNTIIPIIKAYNEAKWMTVGDGKYGSGAYFLKKNGVDVLATSLSDGSLAIAKRKGFIDKFKTENAERLSALDESYDFVLCKESYHHFPRPTIAFYEMLRVSKRGVILIEPQETTNRFLNHAKNIFKKLMRKDKSTEFEISGNFIFRINPREIEKMMTALNYEVVAIKRFNDFYHPRLSHADHSITSFPFIITKLGILIQNLMCALKMLDYGLACIVSFKEIPSESLCNELRNYGFKIISLPKNPYVRES